MPINREPDERHPYPRHWCAPEQETPDDNGGWTCPECGTEWVFGVVDGISLWETPEGRADRLAQEQQNAEARAAAEEPVLQPTAAEPADAPTEPAPTPDAQEPSTANETREDF